MMNSLKHDYGLYLMVVYNGAANVYGQSIKSLYQVVTG